MAHYRRLPLVIEAEQYHTPHSFVTGACVSRDCCGGVPHVHTSDDEIEWLVPGDYVVQLENGGFRRVKQAEFEREHEEVAG